MLFLVIDRRVGCSLPEHEMRLGEKRTVRIVGRVGGEIGRTLERASVRGGVVMIWGLMMVSLSITERG